MTLQFSYIVMAEQIKQVLEKEVTCPLCLDLFKEPKKLPCDHVYCKDCLKGLALRSLDKSISCPECRNVADIPNNDVSNFSTAFRVNRLVEAFQETREETDYHRQDDQGGTCTAHAAQKLVLYCETCKTKLCRDCVIATKEHSQHDYDYIEKVVEKYRKKHEEGLRTTIEHTKNLSQVQLQLIEVESTIASEETTNLENIDRAFEGLHKTLEENKQALKKQLSQTYQVALHTVIENKGRIESLQAQTADVTALVEGALKGHEEALLTQGEQIDDSLRKHHQNIEQLLSTAKPSQQAAEVMSCDMLQKYLDTFNFLYTLAEPKKCKMKIDILTTIGTDQKYILTVDLVDSTGKKCVRGTHQIQAELRSIRGDTASKGTIQRISQGSARITLSTPKRGRNEIHVTIKGVHIANSPQSINFFKPLSQFNEPVAQVGDLQRPAGLTTYGRSLLAIEYSSNTIRKFSRTLEAAEEFGKKKLKGPIALTTDQQMNVYVCTVKDHKVHKFTSDGKHKKSTGKQGTQPGKLNFPMGLRINSQEELHVCDSRNNRVQVFDLKLNFKRVFGGGSVQFEFPTDVDFDKSDNVYVCDSHSDRIQVFTPQAQFIRFIGSERFTIKELELPLNLCIFNDLLFVIQRKEDQVTVFKTSGELVKRFGRGVLQCPEGILVDKDGYVYVSSHHSKLCVF